MVPDRPVEVLVELDDVEELVDVEVVVVWRVGGRVVEVVAGAGPAPPPEPPALWCPAYPVGVGGGRTTR